MINARELKEQAKNISILYVEDDEELRKNTVRLLQTLFQEVETAKDGQEAIDKMSTRGYNIVITDIHMPRMDGIELTRWIKRENPHQAIIITSAHDESKYLLELISIGVDDFVLKPLDINQFLNILSKVVRYIQLDRMEREYKKQLEETVALRTAELKTALSQVKELSDEMVFRLTSAAEYRDTDTGQHILRIGAYAAVLAEKLGMDAKFIDDISFAAPLHDIGKIGIPDSILLKEGPLTEEEFNIMKTHAEIGGKILSGSNYPSINMIETISRQHHERYDGSGYPLGLKGDEISLEGKLVNICDQYDALRSKRPYKPAFDHEKTYIILTEGDSRTRPEHFDPEIMKIFKSLAGEFDTIFNSYQD